MTDPTPREAARITLKICDSTEPVDVHIVWSHAPILARAVHELMADNAELRRGVIFDGDWDGNSNPPTCGICLATASEADDIDHGADCPGAPRDEEA